MILVLWLLFLIIIILLYSYWFSLSNILITLMLRNPHGVPLCQYECNSTVQKLLNLKFKVNDATSILGGMMSFAVKSKTQDTVKCEVIDGGELKSRRHLNVRGKSATLPSITGLFNFYIVPLLYEVFFFLSFFFFHVLKDHIFHD